MGVWKYLKREGKKSGHFDAIDTTIWLILVFKASSNVTWLIWFVNTTFGTELNV